MGKKWDNNIVKLGVVLTISVCVCLVFAELVDNWRSIFEVIGMIVSAMSPFIIGAILAFLLNPIMIYIRRFIAYTSNKFSKKTDYDTAFRNSKIPSLILTILVFFVIIYGFLRTVIPHVSISIQNLVDEMPGYLESAKAWIQKVISHNDMLEGRLSEAIEYIEDNVLVFFENKIVPNLDEIVIKVSNGLVVGVKAVFNFLVGIIVMIYLLASKDVLLAQGKKIVYATFSRKNGNKILEGLSYANSVFGGYINGKILDSIIIGILCFMFTSAIDMKYAVLISVIVGVTNVIPFFGPFIGAIPGALLALMDSPLMFVIFVIFVLILQQFDGNILGPLILGDSTGISGVWVLVAILLGGDLFGVPGMILGVPVFACIYAFCAVQLRDKLREKKLSTKTEDYFRLKGFDLETDEPIYRKKHDFGRRKIKQKKKKSFLKRLKDRFNKVREANEDMLEDGGDVMEEENSDTTDSSIDE